MNELKITQVWIVIRYYCKKINILITTNMGILMNKIELQLVSEISKIN